MRAGSAFLSSDDILTIADVRPGYSVVDIGPGRTGHVLFPAATRVGSSGSVVGVDIAQEVLHMLESTRRQHELHHVKFLWADVERCEDLGLRDQDVVFVVNTAWMFRRHREVLGWLTHMLGRKGKIVVVDWHPENTHALAPRWDFRINPHDLDRALQGYGLSSVYEKSLTPWHWIRVYERG